MLFQAFLEKRGVCGLDAVDREDIVLDDLADLVAVGRPDLGHQHVVAAGGVQRLHRVEVL